MVAQWLFIGCTSLCTKRLYLYRDTPEKSRPTSEMALLITDPDLAKAISSAPKRYFEEGCQWAAEQLPLDTEAYRLSIQDLDGKPIYQGLCLDTTPTFACEVRPGERQVRARLDLAGPWGRESIKEVNRITLAPGGCYFLGADCEAQKNKRLLLKVERLPDSFTPEFRSRLIDWVRRHSSGRTLTD
ncbi:MAG: hypothetical protein A2Y80_09120 [Deltaproteobacteria bacterium RBG_13_58_19]|nr:MAG: hypothetical protein A2Y80_09120 [Deltaproteobacteria bacterium RBG_13_58_19]